MYILVNYVNIDYMIAKKNIDRYFEDENYELDMNYLQTLSIDATEQILRLENVEDENVSNEPIKDKNLKFTIDLMDLHVILQKIVLFEL